MNCIQLSSFKFCSNMPCFKIDFWRVNHIISHSHFIRNEILKSPFDRQYLTVSHINLPSDVHGEHQIKTQAEKHEKEFDEPNTGAAEYSSNIDEICFNVIK